MMVELLNVRPGRIFAVPYRDGRPGAPFAVPSGCVAECLGSGRGQGVPEDLPAEFGLDAQGRPAAPDTPAGDVSWLRRTGVYRMPSGEVAAVYGASANR